MCIRDRYYYGGGTQNGRFSHKGEKIKIVNSNNWVDGGVASPNPFYWSTAGYGVVRNTWKPGEYDFTSNCLLYTSDLLTIYLIHHDNYYRRCIYSLSPAGSCLPLLSSGSLLHHFTGHREKTIHTDLTADHCRPHSWYDLHFP